jgi:hypothetical protein
MVEIKKQIITNEAMEPVGVIISYQDWQKIEALLSEGSKATRNQVANSTSIARTQGEKMAAALTKLADNNAFADIDPVDWQREIRQEKLLPGRE